MAEVLRLKRVRVATGETSWLRSLPEHRRLPGLASGAMPCVRCLPCRCYGGFIQVGYMHLRPTDGVPNVLTSREPDPNGQRASLPDPRTSAHPSSSLLRDTAAAAIQPGQANDQAQ